MSFSNRVDPLLPRLEESALILAIIGARGTGKSTVCRALAERLEARGHVLVVCSRSEDVRGLLADVNLAVCIGPDSSIAPRSDAEVLTAIARRIRAASERVVLLLDTKSAASFAAALMKRSRDRLSIVVVADEEPVELSADLTIDTTESACEWLREQLHSPLDPPLWRQLVALVRSLAGPTDPPSLGELARHLDASAARSLGSVYSLLEPWLDQDVVRLVQRGGSLSPAALGALHRCALLDRIHAPLDLEPSHAQELLAHDLVLQRSAGVHALATAASRSWVRARDSIDIADDEVTDFILELLGREVDTSVHHGALRALGPLRVFFGDGFRAHDAPVWDPPMPPDARPIVADLRHVPLDRRASERWLSRSAEPYLRERLFWIAGADYDEVLALGREVGRSRHQIRRMTPVLVRPEAGLAASIAGEQALHDANMLELRQRLLGSFAAGSFYAAGALLDTPPHDADPPAHAFDQLLAAVLQRRSSGSAA